MKKNRKTCVATLLILLFYVFIPNISLAVNIESETDARLTVSHIDYTNLSEQEQDRVTLDKSETVKVNNITQEDTYLTIVYSKNESLSPLNETAKTSLQKLLPKTGMKNNLLLLIGLILLSVSMWILLKRKQLKKSKILFFLFLFGTGLSIPDLNDRFFADTEYLLEDKTLTVIKGEKFTYNVPEIDGYEKIGYILDENSEEPSIPTPPVKHIGKVEVNYFDTSEEKIIESFILEGEVGESYQTEQKEFTGYEFLETEGDAVSGEFKPEDQTVTYIYKRQQGTVTVHYVDAGGEKLLESVVLTGNVNDTYQTEQKEFSGYEFVETQGDAVSGEFKPEDQTVTYIYSEVIGKVNIICYDQNNIEIHREQISGQVGADYNIEAPSIAGYIFDDEKIPENANGVYTKEEIDVEFFYTPEQGQIVQITHFVYRDHHNNNIIIDEGYSKIDPDGAFYNYTINSIPDYLIADLKVENISGFPLPYEMNISSNGQLATFSGQSKGDVIIRVFVDLIKQEID